MERDEESLEVGRFLALGLALLYVGLQDASDATLETLKAIEHPISRQAQILVEVCFLGKKQQRTRRRKKRRRESKSQTIPCSRSPCLASL